MAQGPGTLLLQTTLLFALGLPQNKCLPLWGPIGGSYHWANIYGAPTVCKAQMDVGAVGSSPGGTETRALLSAEQAPGFLVGRHGHE